MSYLQPVTFYTIRGTSDYHTYTVHKHSIERNQLASFLNIKNRTLLERHILYFPDPLPLDIPPFWRLYITLSSQYLNPLRLNPHINFKYQTSSPITHKKLIKHLKILQKNLSTSIDNYFLTILTTHLIGLVKMNSSGSESSKAFYYFKNAAKSGHSDAQYHLAQYYGVGIRCIQNFAKAFKYFKLAADQNHPEAQLNVGTFYFNGCRTSKNLKKAKHYFEMAAAHKIPGALHNLNLCQKEETKPAQTLQEALSCYVQFISPAIMSKDRLTIVKRCIEIAEHMLQDSDIPQSNRYAFDLLTIAIYHHPDQEALSYKLACLALARIYELGFNDKLFFLQPQSDKAYKLYLQAIPLPDALYRCAYFSTTDITINDKTIITNNPSNYLLYLTRAANEGHAQAQFELGEIHWNDPKLSFHYFSLAALQKHPGALNMLGRMYYDGKGKKINYAKAFSYFVKSASLGHDEAYASLARCYETGNGVQKDLETALAYYQKFADLSPKSPQRKQMNLNCKFLLAKAYQIGDQVQPNMKRAVQLFTEIAQTMNQQYKYYTLYSILGETHAALANIYATGHISSDCIIMANIRKTVIHTEKAVEFFESSGSKDSNTRCLKASFQFRLALLYFTGVQDNNREILSQDHQLYLHFLEQAAINGEANAQYQLAFHYEQGFTDLIAPDLNTAKAYYLKAAIQGHREAFAWIDDKMTTHQEKVC